MAIVKPSIAFPAAADWNSGDVQAYMKDQVPFSVDLVTDVQGADFEQTRFLWVKEKGAFYRLNLASVDSDNGDTVLRDNVGRRYEKQATGGVTPAAARELLSANRTYYVRTNGSNSNTGLVNSAGGAFLTLQKAWDTILTLDLNGFDVTIQVADGTYTAGIVTTKAPVGGNVTLTGNVTTPANVIISATSADALSFDGPMLVTIGGFELRTTTSGFGLNAKGGARVVMSGLMRYGATAWSQMNAIYNGTITINANYTISGAAQSHWRAEDGGLIDCKGRTVTISGTPAFSTAFCVLYSQGRCTPQSNTYSGSATGLRYDINQLSLLHTNGAGATALPGGTSGTANTGAQYV